MRHLLAFLLLGFSLQLRAAEPTAEQRHQMVEQQLAARGISNTRVLAAMRAVPRHRFMPEETWPVAYADSPVAIGHGQTISQPYIVAFMTEALQVKPGMKVLEVGTGSGYQAAVLAELGARVFTIEIVEALARGAEQALKVTGFGDRVKVRAGDGYKGWPSEAPFERIIVTAAPDHVPQPLLEQLAPGGRMIIPVGPEGSVQHLKIIEKTKDGTLKEETLLPVRFVPMTGEAQKK